MKVAAQELMDNDFLLAVVGIGTNETAEMYLGRPGRSNNNEVPTIAPGDTRLFTYVVTNTGESTCRQTIEGAGPTSTVFGFPIPLTTVSKEGNSVTVDDGEPTDLGECFKNLQTQRVVIQVRSGRGYKITENTSPIPAVVLGHSIYNSSTGDTVASVVREVVPDGFVQTFPFPPEP
jgi:hypothetical protein